MGGGGGARVNTKDSSSPMTLPIFILSLAIMELVRTTKGRLHLKIFKKSQTKVGKIPDFFFENF